MKNPKDKGSKFERKICTQLSLWISEGKGDNLLWRSATSGGRFTIGLKKGKDYKNQAGDICSIDAQGIQLTDLFSIECKHYRTIHIDSLIYQKPKNKSILEFWKQTKTDAQKANKRPLLIVRKNNNFDIICFDKQTAQKFYNSTIGKISPIAIFPILEIIVFDFCDFIKIIKFDDFKTGILK